jgi:hypothetical protein
MSLLYSNVLTREVEQNIPAQLRFKREANEDVIVSRMKWRVNSMSSATEYGSGVGTAANKQSLLTFKILCENWLDPQTVRLVGNVKVQGTGVNMAAPFSDPVNTNYLLPVGDSVDSLIRSVRTSINAREFEFVDNYNTLFGNLLTVASCPRDYYNSNGTLQGHWMYLNKSPSNVQNPTIVDATTAPTSYALGISNVSNIFNNQIYIAQKYAAVDGVGTVVGFDFSIPLHCGIFRTGTFLPPRVAIELEITMEDVDKCFRKVLGSAAGAAITNYSYTITNPTILIDQITVHPTYNEKYNEVINAKGLAMECDVYSTVKSDVPASSSMMININRGVSRLRSMYNVMVTGTNTLSNFEPNNFKNFKATINGIAYPSSDGVRGYAEAYDALMQSLSQLNDYNSASLLDYNKYAGKQDGWRAGAPENKCFILGLDFQKSDSRASGTDTAVTGGIVKLELNATANMTAGNMLTFLHFDRGMLIKSDGIVLSE